MSESEFEGGQGGDEVALAAAWTEPIVEAHVAEEAQPAVEEQPEAPAWAGVPREEWEQSQEALAYFASLVEEADQTAQEQAAAEAREAEIEEFLGDPEDAEYGLRLAELERAQLAEYVDERVAPLAELAEQQAIAATEADVVRVLDETFAPLNVKLTDETRAGLIEFAGPELVRAESWEAALQVLKGLGAQFGPEIEALRRSQGGDELDVASRHTVGRPEAGSPHVQAVVQSALGKGPFNGSWVRPTERIR